MNQHLQKILNAINEDKNLSEEEKNAIIKSLKDADKEFEITNFKLDRTEKVKKTTAILLEETIEELEQKRKSVEAQNKELEIESSLERVRTVAMGMTKREDMLDICRIISEQLELLQVQDIRNVQTAIIDEAKHIYLNYEYYRKHDKTFITEVDYTIHPVQSAFALQMLRGKGSFFSTSLEGKKLDEFIEHQKAGPEFVDPFLFESVSLTWYWASLGPIAFGISTYSPLNEESQEIVKRFRNVFDLSYRRYLDIENAEAQAKEAQIETSLERVRAQAMAMRTPEDLTGICEVLYAELHTLGFTEIRNAMINIHDDAKESFVNYDYSDEIGKSINHLTYDVHPLIAKQIKQGKSTEGFSETSFTGKDLEDSIAFRKKAGEKDDPRMEKADALYYYFYSIGIGSIGISTFSVVAEEKLNVLKRFRNVFNLSYQRYTDIALAEVQAKEAKIELALERVRARTMAMQKSAELGETAYVLFQQFEELGEDPEQIGIGIMNEEDKILELWSTINGKMRERVVKVPLYEPILINKLYKAWKEDKKSVTVDISGKELEDYNKFRNSLAEIKIDTSRTNKRRVVSAANFSKGHITLATTEPRPAETLQLLERFAKVFDGTYTRFLDLQKSEAQTKAAQIELAVERVRAKALAMHNSTQILEVVTTLRNEMLGLEIPGVVAATIYLQQEEEGYIRMWDLSSVIEMEDGFHVAIDVKFKLDETDPGLYIRRVWNNDTNYFVEKQDEKDMAITIEWLRQYYPQQAAEVQQFIDTTPWKYLMHPTIQLAHGKMSVDIMDTQPPAEMESILQKMGAAFDLAYKRFLDLQKSETQIREAQIELALERVRARTMAMQHSGELADAASVLFRQIKELGFETWSCGFCSWQKNDMVEVWMGADSGGLLPAMMIPYKKELTHKDIYEASLTGAEAHEKIWRGEKLEEHYTFLKTIPSVKDAIDILEQSGLTLPEQQCYYVGFFEQGYLLLITKEPNDELKQLSKRFAKVFNQTYTRFLDLQKAEAQAREAKIEAALEKVRSRSLAMQKSEELKEVIQVVYEQFVLLNVNTEHTGFVIDYKLRDDRLIWVASKHGVPSQLTIPYFDSEYYNSFNKAKDEGLDFFATNLSFEGKNNFYRELFKYIPGLPGDAKEFYFNCPGLAISTVLLENVGLYIENFEGIPYSEEDNAILMRFGKVFQQTYTRFLDLQKAEAQSRENQIQLALERARSQSMIMQHSNELDDTLRVFHEQVLLLNIPSAFSFLWLPDEKNDKHIFWAAWKEEENDSTVFKSKAINYPLDRNEPATAQCLIDWKGTEPIVSYHVPPACVENYFAAWQELINGVEQLKPEHFSGGLYYVEAFMKYGCFGVIVTNDLTEDEKKILGRFAIEFERTYRRFLDLHKAEAQAREAQIEAALEKVRSRSLAMHKSDEIIEVVRAVFDRLGELNIELNTAFIIIFKEGSRDTEWWLINKDKNEFSNILVKYAGLSILKEMFETKEQGEELFSKTYYAEEKNELFHYLFTETDFKYASAERQKYIFDSEAISISMGMTNKIAIQITRHNERSFSEADNEILKRFTKVFDQSYIRFLDLEKAEAQAREARIEAALEKVRSRSLAMHKSEELGEISFELFNQIQALGVATWHCAFNVYDDDKNTSTEWGTNAGGTYPKYNTPREGIFLKYYQLGKAGETLHTEVIGEDRCGGHYEWLCTLPGIGEQLIKLRDSGLSFPTSQIDHVAYFKYGYLLFITYEQVPGAHDIFKRFAKVFEQTYTRFLDLKKAEAQAREAQVEAALEKVRSRTMAMQHSNELLETATQLFQQIEALGAPAWNCSFNIWIEDKKRAVAWNGTKDGFGRPFTTNSAEDVFLRFFEADQRGEELYVEEIGSSALEQHYDYLGTVPGVGQTLAELKEAGIALPSYQVFNIAYFSHGYLMFITYEPVPQLWDVFKRFAKVFEQTYTRFLDLQKAEAQTKEAQIEASLERVRSRTLAMQRSDELAETAAVLFRQLISLGIAPNRLYISIIKNENGEAEFWITDEDGSKVSSAFETNLNDNPTFKKMFDGWKQEKKSLVIDMQGDELQEYFKYLTSIHVPFKGGLTQTRRLQDIAYFSKGFIGIASPDTLPEGTILLLERFAAVFNLTYTRFNDLKVAEAHAIQAEEDLIKLQTEKKRAEDALTELRSTQTQLIQSEKMASLGELTAGIAHEIQNPLNFVNNFSEVSNELIEELKTEKAKPKTERDEQLEEDLLNDIAQNLEKINHHGKRADAIVKGMLQHSRSSTSTKEPTDINKLADEYLRLAYHGLRAKDKSFNATLKTDYDETIGNINIIPQDIGRVVLNLITNAFYAVNTPQPPKGGVAYVPTVSVSTKKVNGKIEVNVGDNGTGIPKNIVDKIFQPFFTTKPTGQGTGLGLSLAYDIVKAHGGELKVETQENSGTTFIIQLPAI